MLTTQKLKNTDRMLYQYAECPFKTTRGVVTQFSELPCLVLFSMDMLRHAISLREKGILLWFCRESNRWRFYMRLQCAYCNPFNLLGKSYWGQRKTVAGEVARLLFKRDCPVRRPRDDMHVTDISHHITAYEIMLTQSRWIELYSHPRPSNDRNLHMSKLVELGRLLLAEAWYQALRWAPVGVGSLGMGACVLWNSTAIQKTSVATVLEMGTLLWQRVWKDTTCLSLTPSVRSACKSYCAWCLKDAEDVKVHDGFTQCVTRFLFEPRDDFWIQREKLEVQTLLQDGSIETRSWLRKGKGILPSRALQTWMIMSQHNLHTVSAARMVPLHLCACGQRQLMKD